MISKLLFLSFVLTLPRSPSARQHPGVLPRASGQPGRAGLGRLQDHAELRLRGRRRALPLQQGQDHDLRPGQGVRPARHAGGGERRGHHGFM